MCIATADSKLELSGLPSARGEGKSSLKFSIQGAGSVENVEKHACLSRHVLVCVLSLHGGSLLVPQNLHYY